MPSLPNIKKKTFLYILLIFVLFIGIWSGATYVRKRGEVSLDEREPGKEELAGELVGGFPELPVYPEATILKSYKKQEGEKVGFEANWEVDASVGEIMAWYIDALKEAGWVFEEEPVVDETSEQSLVARKDNVRVYLIVEREEGALITEINAEFPIQ